MSRFRIKLQLFFAADHFFSNSKEGDSILHKIASRLESSFPNAVISYINLLYRIGYRTARFPVDMQLKIAQCLLRSEIDIVTHAMYTLVTIPGLDKGAQIFMIQALRQQPGEIKKRIIDSLKEAQLHWSPEAHTALLGALYDENRDTQKAALSLLELEDGADTQVLTPLWPPASWGCLKQVLKRWSPPFGLHLQ